MRRCFESRPKLQPLGKEDQQLIGTVRFYSFEALRIALNQRDIGRGSSTVLLGGHEIPRGLVLLYLSHLEALRDWRKQRQICWLLLYVGLTAIFTAATAVGTLAPLLGTLDTRV